MEVKVTISQFLANGGKLEEGRKIYSGVEGHEVGDFDGFRQDGQILINQIQGAFYGDPDFFAVKIKVIPIWE